MTITLIEATLNIITVFILIQLPLEATACFQDNVCVMMDTQETIALLVGILNEVLATCTL